MPIAKELIMSGRRISAEEALRIGLVNRVCKEDSLYRECETTVLEICQNSFPATWQAKRAINSSFHMGLKEAFEHERNMCALCFASPERAQAMTAFLEK
jgi:enoyl-CoA hydratase